MAETTKLVQVPMGAALRAELDAAAATQGKARAEVIREACRRYLQRLHQEELKRQYVEGYRRIPEEVAELSGFLEAYTQVLPPEEW
jgi:metal-responsive CopG/Arc/MetJ family transcriptional regulator